MRARTHTHSHARARTHSQNTQQNRQEFSAVEAGRSLIWFGSFCLPVVTNMKTRRGEWLAQCGTATLEVVSGLDRAKTQTSVACGRRKEFSVHCRRRVLP